MNNAKQVFISILRNKQTDRPTFQETSNRLAHILAHEAMEYIATHEIKIETPVGSAIGTQLTRPIILVPILRSGITLLPAFLQYFRNASVGVVGLKRDEETAQAHWYYKNLPPMAGTEKVIILDPMIATGGTGIETLRWLKNLGVEQNRILFVSIVCAPEGLRAIKEEFPGITIITAVVDDHLNDKKFIVPGLGDFGDRFFGTK